MNAKECVEQSPFNNESSAASTLNTEAENLYLPPFRDIHKMLKKLDVIK